MAGVTWSWPGHQRPVLDGVGLGVWPGQQVVIVGDNGAGKTTLLRIVAGLLDAPGSDILLGGERLSADRVAFQRRLGLLTAGNAGLYARLTVRRHLRLCARATYVPAPKREERIAAVVQDFELGDLVERRTDRLSMGQRQRVRLALTFLHEPDVVLLDEPTTSLDDNGRALLDRVLARHRARGGAVVWASPGSAGTAPEAGARLQLRNGRLSPA